MNCPSCKDVVLTMTERQGVEIDYCPQCRGVWLDRGELDKIIERAERDFGAAGAVAPAGAQPYSPSRTGDPQWNRDSDDRPSRGHYGGRRKSFWKELFDD